MTLKTMKRKGIAMRKNLKVNCDEEKSGRKQGKLSGIEVPLTKGEKF